MTQSLAFQQLEIPGLAVVRGNCKITGKPYQTGPVKFAVVKEWLLCGKPTSNDLKQMRFWLPYSEETIRFIIRGISPKGWRLINEPVLNRP